MSAEIQLMTAAELLMLPRGQCRYELINGELKTTSLAGFLHGRITLGLAAHLARYVKENRLGQVYAAGTGFRLTANPDTVRAADVAFIRQQSFDEVEETSDYWPAAPNLAIEVLDFDDIVCEIEEKVAEWLDAGSEQVWVLSPQLQTITIYRSRTEISVLTMKDNLFGDTLIPGFQIPVAEIFAE